MTDLLELQAFLFDNHLSLQVCQGPLRQLTWLLCSAHLHEPYFCLFQVEEDLPFPAVMEAYFKPAALSIERMRREDLP